MARIKKIDKLTFRDLIINYETYQGLPDGLIQLPPPVSITIDGAKYHIPTDYAEFEASLCYGQRMYLVAEETDDFGVIIRILTGYYFPIVTKDKWDNENALLFGRKVINCKAKEVYPVAALLIKHLGQLAERERNLLHREPTKLERAAGIEKLNVFSDLTSLDFLRDEMKITTEEVLLQPYKECLVRFMLAKEKYEYQERLFKLMQEETEAKLKRKKL